MANSLKWQERYNENKEIYYIANLQLPFFHSGDLNFVITKYEKNWELKIRAENFITLNFKTTQFIYDTCVKKVKQKTEKYYKNELKQYINNLMEIL